MKFSLSSLRPSFSLRLTTWCGVLSMMLSTSEAKLSTAAPFVVTSPEKNFTLPAIIFPDTKDSEAPADFDYNELAKTSQSLDRYEQSNPSLEAVRYLRDGILKITGKELPVIRSSDKSKGIVFTTLEQAPEEIQKDPEVVSALRKSDKDPYNAHEAFFVRTEPERTLIVTNTVEGFNHAVVSLLESVGYEVLGMGPNWTHTPNYRDKPLVFNLKDAGRPGFYIRQLGLTSGQAHGIGTLYNVELPDPEDEPVEVSVNRWGIGTRTLGMSMPPFLGHAMQNYAREVLSKREELGTTDGFLNEPNATVSIDGVRTLVDEDGTQRSVKLDKSVPFVREIIFEDLKKKSEAFFDRPEYAGEVFLFGTDPEDGVQPHEFTRYPNWYPEYLKKEGIPFGKPYVLNGFRDLNQPTEIWDPGSFTDTTFGFNNWLLWEYDKWIDSLPEEQRKTQTGQSKKELVRISLYSYNAHDVPPNFNLDPRIRVMIAGYPKNRGIGKWKNFASQIDMAQAFQIMLPNEPSGDYTIPSFALYKDFDTSQIRGSQLSQSVQNDIRKKYDAGIRAVSMETDLNFGKMGLQYYLISKMLWNPDLTPSDLESLRERWLQRSYGKGWKEMQGYYDFLAPENFAVNAPNNWAKAIAMIAAADEKIDPKTEPAAQKRLDDLKQFWYFYYLLESGELSSNPTAVREFFWKGQMSYITAMQMVAQRYFQSQKPSPAAIAGPEFNTGPAHYTAEETAAWWKKVRDYWTVIPVAEFSETTLSNGKPVRKADLNDLVAVAEFQSDKPEPPFLYSSGTHENAAFRSVASKSGDELGFKLAWPFKPNDSQYRPRELFYGVDHWNTDSKQWDELVDATMVSTASQMVTGKNGEETQMVEARYVAPKPGTYRFRLGYGGDLSDLGSLGYDPQTGESPPLAVNNHGFTFDQTQTGHHQGPSWFYIPKGVKSIDLEVWRPTTKMLVLHHGLPATGLEQTRTIDVSEKGTHRIALEPGEDGSFAMLEGGVIYFPYLYSVPMLWSKSPSALLVPREVAKADGLTILP